MDVPPPDEPTRPEPQPPILLPAADLSPLSQTPLILKPAGISTAKLAAVIAAGMALIVVIGLGVWLFRVDTIAFLFCAAIVPPMVALPLLAYVGDRIPAVRPVTVIWWLLLAALGASTAYGTAASATEDGARRLWVLAGVCAGAVVGIACFAPQVRRAASRGIPIDPLRFVHATALASVVSLTIIFFVPLVVLGGPPALADASTEQLTHQMQDLPPGLILRLTCYLYVWVIVGFLCFVGFPIARSLGAALERLGLVSPTWWQVAGALVAACALVVVITVMELGIDRLWSTMGWPKTDQAKFEQMMAFANSPIGAVVIGICAGLSEELFFRGILQPRLGILLANLCFTAFHAFQYNWDALLSVFVIGLLLGLVRKKTNTTTSAIVHGTYDFLLVLASYYQFDPTKWLGG